MSNADPHFVVCIQNEGCEDLQLRKLYEVLPDETAAGGGLLRVIDDSIGDRGEAPPTSPSPNAGLMAGAAFSH